MWQEGGITACLCAWGNNSVNGGGGRIEDVGERTAGMVSLSRGKCKKAVLP